MDKSKASNEGIAVRLRADPKRVRSSVRRTENGGLVLQIEDRQDPSKVFRKYVTERDAQFGLINLIEDALGRIEGIVVFHDSDPKLGFDHPFDRKFTRAEMDRFDWFRVEGDAG